MTVETASLLARGEILRIYGPEADPILTRIRSRRTTLKGDPVIRIDAIAEVTRSAERVRQPWTFWIGPDETGRPSILRSRGPGSS